MKKLSAFLKPYVKESILGPLFKLLEAGFELFVPLVMASIIDRGVRAADEGHVLRMSLLLILLGVIGLVCSVTAQYYAAKASVGFASDLRESLFSHLQTLSYPDLDRLGTSTMITRLTSDMNQLQTGLNLALRLLLRSPLVVFGAAIMAFTVDAEAALVFAVMIPLLALVVFGIMLLSIPMFRRVQAKVDRLLGLTRSGLNGVRVIRAFRKEKEQEKAFGEANEELTAMQKAVGRFSALQSPVTYVIVNLAIAALILKGALRVEAGDLTQGQVVALYNYMTQILIELVKLANLIITITKSIACGSRISAVLETSPSIRDGAGNTEPVPGAPAVEFDGVSLLYPGAGEESLRGISLRAYPGETIGIIGGTGAGKTSLVNLIPRFYEATEGQVCVNGIPVGQYRLADLRAMIAVVPQKALLFHGTVRDNLKWGSPDATDEELLDACRAAQATFLLSEKGKGLDTVIEQNGRNLSGGQRQRLTIARALVRRPGILILDDASSALDYATDAALRKALKELPFHPTVFLVAQRTSSVRHADRILVLEDGIPCAVGDHQTLLASCGVYKEIYDTQFGEEETV